MFYLKKSKFCTFSKQRIEIIYSKSKSIYYNGATEEFLFKHYKLNNPLLFLWQNDKNVVIGRHQNPWKECFIQKMEEENVKLMRRRTGGGAVYQDLGNSVFSFINHLNKEESVNDLKKINNEILINSLKKLNINAEVSGRNDLTINNKKISGAAFQIDYSNNPKGLLLHHGTMLLNVDFSSLEKYLNVNKKKLESKGITSVTSRVINLKNINKEINHDILCEKIHQSFTENYKDSEIIIKTIDQSEMEENPIIQKIYNELIDYEWLYQKSPKFSNNFEKKFDFGLFDIYVNVAKGIIIEGTVFSDHLDVNFIKAMNDILNSKKESYSKEGMVSFSNKLKKVFHKDENLIKQSEEIKNWLISEL